jgi:arylsulfatase A-like enzyme
MVWNPPIHQGEWKMALDRRAFLGSVGAATAAMMFPSCRPVRRPPNFVFLLIDDLGWVDTGTYGSTFYETPNVDALASSGMRFTAAYAASPVCSPTRASILTGQHPARLDITDWIGGSQRGMLLPAEYAHQLPLAAVTIAEALGQAGYVSGFVGKWHLGDDPYLPQQQGFALNVAGHGAGQPASYFYPYRDRDGRSTRWDVPDLAGGSDGEYLTDRLTDEALRFLEARQNDPFLLYLAHYAVHTPIESKQELTERYRAKLESLPPLASPAVVEEHGRAFTRQVQDNPAYAGMIQSVDESVGRVLEKLDDLGIADDTIVIFMSDNGGLSTLAGTHNAPTTNVPLRAGKGWLYEGGIREPLLVRWPGIVEQGSVCSVPVTSSDFFPTMLEMAGLPLQPGLHRDGVSLVPLLSQRGVLDRDALYWHFPHYHGSGSRPSGAVRVGDYKLIEWFEDGAVELYDLATDLGETTDLSERMPEWAAALKARLTAWREEVGANMTRPNTESQ